MSHFHDAMHPDDLPPWSGEPEDTEESDAAVTEWFGGRQPVLEPVDALLGQKDEQ